MSDDLQNAALLTNIADGIDAPMLIEMLENEGIACWAADSSSGSFLRSCIGFSPAGRQIYVEKSRLEDAKGILEAFFSESPTDNFDPYVPQESEEQPVLPSRQNRIALCIGVIVVAAVVLLLAFGLK